MDLKFILESLLFASPKPLSVSELREVLAKAAEGTEDPLVLSFRKAKAGAVEAALEELARDHETAARSYRLVCVAGSWQFVSLPDFSPWLRAFVGVKNRPPRLSQAALETLAIIAYRQPATRAEIEQIRGVAVDGVMQTLLERELIAAAGRAEVVGRPVQYITTQAFLEYFGLPNLNALPAAEELRRIPVERPESLATAEPSATPPEQLSLDEAERAPQPAPSVPESPSAPAS
ncbi:MAG: SMC-Scp complex subunit ScpB [Verrucomicrobia bacterium]|nr:SMC-Scp complex subunit ScpB [Verrucomicrobiota bacterium]